MRIKVELSPEVLLEVGKRYEIITVITNLTAVEETPVSAIFDISWRVLLDGLNIPIDLKRGIYFEPGETKDIKPRPVITPLYDWAGKSGVVYVEVFVKEKMIADGYKEIYVLPIVPL